MTAMCDVCSLRATLISPVSYCYGMLSPLKKVDPGLNFSVCGIANADASMRLGTRHLGRLSVSGQLVLGVLSALFFDTPVAVLKAVSMAVFHCFSESLPERTNVLLLLESYES